LTYDAAGFSTSLYCWCFLIDGSDHDTVQGGACGTNGTCKSPATTALLIAVDRETADVCHGIHVHASVCHCITDGHSILWASPAGNTHFVASSGQWVTLLFGLVFR